MCVRRCLFKRDGLSKLLPHAWQGRRRWNLKVLTVSVFHAVPCLLRSKGAFCVTLHTIIIFIQTILTYKNYVELRRIFTEFLVKTKRIFWQILILLQMLYIQTCSLIKVYNIFYIKVKKNFFKHYINSYVFIETTLINW